MRVLLRAALAVPVFGLIAGCSEGPPFGQVRGQVTMDGKPVQDGLIRFVPLEPGFPGSGGKIVGGSFDVKVPATRQRVELNGVKLGANGKPVMAGPDSAEELFPPKYNLKSELVVEVKTGANTYDLDLKSK